MKKAIVLLAVVVAIAAAGIWCMNKSYSVMASLSPTLAQELSNALGVPVEVGELKVNSFHSVTVRNMAVYDKDRALVASSPAVTVNFSLWAILQGKPAAAAIDRLTVREPVVQLDRRPAGDWNIADLWQQQASSEQAFHGIVEIINGSAAIRAAGQGWAVTDIQGEFDFSVKPGIALKGTALYGGKPVKAQGVVQSSSGQSLTVWAEELTLADFAVLFPAESALKPVEGQLRQVTVNWQQSKGDSRLAGEAELVQAGLDMEQVAVRNINGHIAFTDKAVYLFDTAVKVWQQPLTLRGKITFSGQEPVVDLTVASTGFDPSVLPVELPLQGTVAFSAAVSGRLDNPAVKGQFSLPQGTVSGVPVSNGKASLRLSDKLVTLEDVQADLWEGHVALQGVFDSARMAYYLQLTGSHINTQAVPVGTAGLSGYADVTALIDGQGAIGDASIGGTVHMASGAVAGVSFTGLEAGFFHQNGMVNLDYLQGQIGQGTVTASGTVPLNGESIRLTVYGRELPLASLAGVVDKLPLAGTANLHGSVDGTLTQPHFSCEFTATDGQVLQQPFAKAQGQLEATPELLRLNQVVLSHGAGSHEINGSLGLSGDRPVNLHILSHQVRAENLVDWLLPGEKLTGNVDNEVWVTGPLSNYNLEGTLRLTEGSFRGQLIARAEGRYQRKQGVTTIQDFMIDSLNTKISVTGTVSADDRLDFAIVAKDIDLGKLHVNFPYPVSGQANFAGKLTGTVDQPLFDGDLAAERLSFNGQNLSAVSANLTFHNNQLEVAYLKFLQDKGSFTFRGGIDIASNEVYGSLDVVNGNLASLLPVLNVPAQEVEGLLNGTIRMSGVLPEPNFWLSGNMVSGKIKKYPLENISIDASLVNHVLTVNTFTAQQGTGILAVRGTADFNGAIQMEVGGRDIDAGLLAVLADSPVDVKGNLGFAAQLSGQTKQPHADMSLEITQGSVGNASFDSLYGLFRFDDGKINVNQLLLSKGTYRASAYGTVPLAALDTSRRQQTENGEQMDLKLRLDEADLSILPFLSKEISWAQGPTQGELALGGTLDRPRINGHVSVKNGIVKLAMLNDPIQNVGVDIQFQNDKINVNTFEGQLGSGSYQVTGSARLQGFSLADYDLTAALNNPFITSKYFRGPVNGNLSLKSDRGRPVLAGRLRLENDTIDIPLVPDLQSSDLNLGLDLEVSAGNKVRLYNPYLYDIQVGGRVNFAGTTQRPDVSGRFFAKRGTVSYLRTQFTIKEAVAEFSQFGSFEPVLRLSAETKLQRTKVTLGINGPVSEMNFTLESDPEMSQQELLSLLTLRSRYYSDDNKESGLGKDELMSVLDAGLQLRFVSEVENIFQNALGLDEFHVIRDTFTDGDAESSAASGSIGQREGYNLEVSKYLTDRFMVTYNMGIDHDSYKWDFRYDLTRRISITGGTDDEKDHRLGIEARYRF